MVSTHGIKVVFSLPTHQHPCTHRISVASCHIPGTAWSTNAANGAAAGYLKSTNHFKHAVTTTCAQIDRCALLFYELFKSAKMTSSKIHYMNVVTYASAIWGRIVITPYVKPLA